jgi:hypothetical protein
MFYEVPFLKLIIERIPSKGISPAKTISISALKGSVVSILNLAKSKF